MFRILSDKVGLNGCTVPAMSSREQRNLVSTRSLLYVQFLFSVLTSLVSQCIHEVLTQQDQCLIPTKCFIYEFYLCLRTSFYAFFLATRSISKFCVTVHDIGLATRLCWFLMSASILSMPSSL